MDMESPWEHPDWYDLHDVVCRACGEREPEHYRELLLALPPLDAIDHLVDLGAGTGKLSRLIAQKFPELGRLTLLDPNEKKLQRAQTRIAELIPRERIHTTTGVLGEGEFRLDTNATVVVVGSVLMPIMQQRGGTLRDGLDWLRRSLEQIMRLMAKGSCFYALETISEPWARSTLDQPVRRLLMLELIDEVERAGLESVECVYRFRDRVVIRARRPNG